MIQSADELQTTLGGTACVDGVGLFTGEKVSVSICPAPPNSGIVFQRMDLPGCPQIPALLTSVRQAPRCTRLAAGEANVFMVEHLLSAMYGCRIDNAIIQVHGPEVPAGDGSSKFFVDLIEETGVVCQPFCREYLQIREPVYWSEESVHLVALPASEFRLSYTLHYPHSLLLKTQYFSIAISEENYKKEIASCRTFSLYEEILPYIEKGIIRGGGLENALVIHGDKVLNPEGARFPDEMVRHKVLDLIGDLALIGKPLLAHVIAIRSGHSSNVAFASAILKHYETPLGKQAL